MTKVQAGDRVVWDMFGPGTVLVTPECCKELYEHMGWVHVLFDTAPPLEFNMRVNPTFAPLKEISMEAEE